MVAAAARAREREAERERRRSEAAEQRRAFVAAQRQVQQHQLLQSQHRNPQFYFGFLCTTVSLTWIHIHDKMTQLKS